MFKIVLLSLKGDSAFFQPGFTYVQCPLPECQGRWFKAGTDYHWHLKAKHDTYDIVPSATRGDHNPDLSSGASSSPAGHLPSQSNLETLIHFSSRLQMSRWINWMKNLRPRWRAKVFNCGRRFYLGAEIYAELIFTVVATPLWIYSSFLCVWNHLNQIQVTVLGMSTFCSSDGIYNLLLCNWKVLPQDDRFYLN